MLIRKSVAIYGRVMTDWKTNEYEIEVLRKVARQRDWVIGEIYIDDAIKRANGGDRRRAFQKILLDARDRQFQSVMSWSIAQLARSVQGMSGFISEMAALNMDQYYHVEGIDTFTSEGKAMVQMCVALTEFGRASAQRRIVASRSGTRGAGRRSRAKLDAQTEWAICQALAAGTKAIEKIATDFSIPASSVRRIRAEMNKFG